MPSIGGITFSSPEPVGTFPLVTSFPHGRAQAPEVVVHRMGGESANGKIDQRYLIGNGAKVFTVKLATLPPQRLQELMDFWIVNQGAYGAFYYAAPNEDQTTTEYVCRFRDQSISFEYLTGAICTTGIELVEIVSTGPSYALAGTVTRFPNDALEAALAGQVQEIIPLIRIQARDPDYPVIYLSDRLVTVGGQEYQPRLVDWDGIEQGMAGATDTASFTFGNADRVMTLLVNDVNLFRADIQFSLFHVGTALKIDLWRGDIADWKAAAASPVMTVQATDGLYELNQMYPRRKISRRCWKTFDDAANGCPFTASGTLHSARLLTNSDRTTTTYAFSPSEDECDKGWATTNGCLAHGMDRYFGGIIATPQTVRTKDNSTGTWGFGRSRLTSASMVADSVYGEVVPEIYCKIDHPDVSVGFPVNAKVAAGRDEGDFYNALGIIGEGPIEEFAHSRGDVYVRPDGSEALAYNPHKLDGQDHHGWTNYLKDTESAEKAIQSTYGLRLVNGEDPVPEGDEYSFSLGEGGDGIQRYGPERAAGTAFIEIRRSDEKGLQLSRLSEHSIQTAVRNGISGYTWEDNLDGTFTRSELTVLNNPVWIAINAHLKMVGLQFADSNTQLGAFDGAAAAYAAWICDQEVPKIVGDGTETQFTFTGVLQEAKPWRDWLQEILNNCLGYYTFAFKKLKIGIRHNSSAVEQFSDGNIIWGSLQYEPLKPSFWHIQGTFADEEYGYVSNTVEVEDETYSALIGGVPSKSQINFTGASSKSQVARLITTRLREEMGGWQPSVQKVARRGRIKTTLLGLTVEPGSVCRLDHGDLPDMPATVAGSVDPEEARTNHIQFRVERWRLNKDYSIDIEWRSIHNEIYDLVAGPKPADVAANELPVEELFAPSNWRYYAYTKQDGKLRLNNFAVGRYGDTVHQGFFDIYYRDEAHHPWLALGATLEANATEIIYGGLGPTPQPGDLIQIEAEICKVTGVDVGAWTLTLERAQLGTTAVRHAQRAATVVGINEQFPNELTVESGLAIQNGEILLEWGGTFEAVSQYNQATGSLITTRPLEVTVGTTVTTDALIWKLQVRREQIPFQPRFFRSPNRSKFEHEIDLPGCGVALIRGYLTNTRGVPSETVICAPAAMDRMEPMAAGEITSAWPHALRTHDNLTYQMPREHVLPLPPTSEDAGEINAFEPILLPEAQTFRHAYADVTNAFSVDAEAPIEWPAALTSISVSEDAFASISLIGAFDEAGQLHVVITGENELRVPVWRAVDFPELSTLEGAAESLCNWLNADEPFAAYYQASVVGAEIRIVAKIPFGGNLEVDYIGAMIPIASGRLTGLGITQGRRYAIVYTGGSDLVSSPSPLSDSTGPAVSAFSISLTDIPQPSDERVTAIKVYAVPDGQDWPLYLIDTLEVGETTLVDGIAEADLTARSDYEGPSQPGMEGNLLIRVKADGLEWFDLFVPAGEARSNVADGYAIAPKSEGTEITADVRYRLVEEPTEDRPGFPIDVRIVIE